MTAARPAISVEKVSKRYLGSRKPVDALVDVELDVARGEIFGFLGPNGSGKTTMLRILATILQATTGTAIVEGRDVRQSPMEVRSSIGYMPEKPAGYPLLTGMQNLLYWAELQDVDPAERRERAKVLLAELGLQEASDRKVRTYSLGMAKRLMMAQALIHDPPVLLLDEPAGGLDPQGIRFFRDLLQRLRRQGKTVFLSSHLLSEVEQTCTSVAVLHKGRVLATGRMDDLQQRILAGTDQRLAVECEPLTSQVAEALKAVPGIRTIQPTASGFEVDVAPGADVAFEVGRVLVEHHVNFRALRPQPRRLEDTYLALIPKGES